MPLTTIKELFAKLSISLLHGLFMLLLSCIWLNIGYSIGLEETLLKLSADLKRVFFSDKAKLQEIARNYSFIDVSGNPDLQQREDGTGSDVVTDRQVLDSFLQILNRHNGAYQFTLCDVIFDKPTAHDSALTATFAASANYVIPYFVEDGKLLMPTITVPAERMGYAGYDISEGLQASGKLLKYQLFYRSTLKSMLAMMYEHITQKPPELRYGLLWIDNKPYFNTLIFDMAIKQASPGRPDEGAAIIPLNYALNLLKTKEQFFFDKFFRNKIIIIGNYRSDLHETAYGTVPGPLILANLYETMAQGRNHISTGWILFMLLSFSILSYLLFYFSTHRRLWSKMKRSVWGRKLLRWLTISLAVWFISLLSYFLFGVHSGVIVMILYLGVITSLLKRKEIIIKKLHTGATPLISAQAPAPKN